jgi:REP element-mobilizing transposase RayT
VSFQRKKIRLPSSRYSGKQIYFVTLCCEDRRPIFTNESLGYWLVSELLKSAAEEGFAIHAYCVMPDHFHILVEGMIGTCDLVRFVSSFKQETAFSYTKKMAASFGNRDITTTSCAKQWPPMPLLGTSGSTPFEKAFVRLLRTIPSPVP